MRATLSLGHIHPCWHPALCFLCPKCLPWAKARWLGDDVALREGQSVFELVLHRAEKARVGSAPALGACCSSCPAPPAYLKNLSPSHPEAGEMWCWTSLGLAHVQGLGRGHSPDTETVFFILSISSVLFPLPAPAQQAQQCQTRRSCQVSCLAEPGLLRQCGAEKYPKLLRAVLFVNMCWQLSPGQDPSPILPNRAG